MCVGQRFVDDRSETTQLRMPSASGDVTEAVLRGATLGPFSTLMVRADVIEAVGFPDERFPAWQDREWHVRLSQEGDWRSASYWRYATSARTDGSTTITTVTARRPVCI